jgi:digeranylgeranylglycerophospholipid reductase
MEVLMIEKRQEIGSPIRCAEGVSTKALVELIELDPRWISAEINGSRIHSPDGNFIRIDDPGAGLILERKIFDREIATQAERAGAEIWVKARAVDLLRQDGRIAGALVRRNGVDYTIKAKVVIAADGVESQAGRWAGIDTTCKLSDVDTCAQYFITGIDIDSDYCDFYLGQEIAPRGYAWVFPKGENSANVGLGIGGHISTRRAIDYLNSFLEREFPNGSPVAMVAGCVPVCGALRELVRDGFMIVGDAAHQNDPVSGGGIINSMIAGQIAGEIAVQAIKNDDVSRKALSEYQKLWHKRIGRTFGHLKKLRDGAMRFSDEKLNDIARLLSHIDPKELSLISIFKAALKNDPKLLLELRHLISMGWG